jgi:two-component system CheB/CheR fusion protein
VGIGASAGGLEALTELFKSMPADTGLGFVVVQHLAPTTESSMPEILQRSTRMPVSQAKNGLAVQPDQIYIIPPGKNMAILRGKLQLFEHAGPADHVRHPIDTFLESLARDRGTGAIAVILSGTGMDGTLGARVIKAEMGLVIAQDLETAAYDGMPRSVIEAGLADYILSPANMAHQLQDYARRSSDLALPRSDQEPGDIEKELPRIISLIRDDTGNDFSDYKEGTLLRRIKRRMLLHQIEKAADYVRFLQQQPGEKTVLFKELLINVTSFFRDPAAFDALKARLQERLLSKSPQEEVRTWVIGCATGEEAYSIAILFQEILNEIGRSPQVQIFATDLDSDAINIARSGIYGLNIARDITPQRLSRYFTKLDDNYQVRKEVREMIVFAVHSLIKDPPFLKLDMISARNLLIYIKGDLQQKLIPLFYHALNPEGLLFLGTAETVGNTLDLFQEIDRKWRLYRRKDAGSSNQYLKQLPLRSPLEALPIEQSKGGPKTTKMDILLVTDRLMLSEYAPAYVVTDNAFNIVYVRGDTGKYLKLGDGLVTMNILDQARKGLRTYLSLALRKANTQNTEVIRPGVMIEVDNQLQPVTIIVRPLPGQSHPSHFMVVFREAQLQEAPEVKGKLRGAGKEAFTERDQHIAELEQELKQSKENLQAMVEELEASNEELKSSNEELLSTNEELQSTNEELQTSQEELRSVNEELSTLNTENQDRIEQLVKAQDDMRNLLNTTEVATIFLDSDLNIQSFTSAATRLFSLRDSDRGRPINEITSSLKYDGLVADAQDTLRTLKTTEKEIDSKEGKWYVLRIIPYRTQQNEITGLVLTFIDIDQRKILQAALHYTQNIVDTVREPMLVLDKDSKVVSANRSFYQTFRVKRSETEGRLVYELGNRQWNIPDLRKLLQEVIPQNNEFENYLVTHDFPNIGLRKMLLNARKLYDELGSQRILLAIEDITEQNSRVG